MKFLRLMGRAVHGVTYAVLLAVVVTVAAVVALWWWTGTQASLDWALQRWGMTYRIQAESPTGSLRSGISAARLRWQGSSLMVEATGVDIGWNPLALITRELKLTRVKADQLVIVDGRPPTSEPAQPPTDLRLPLDVTVDEFKVNRLRWESESVIEAANLVGRYYYSGKQHVLGVNSAEYAGGRYSGEVRLGALAPLALEARLRGNFGVDMPGSGEPVRLGVEATLRGPLTQFEAAAQLQSVQPPRPGAVPGATATARITPWQKPIVPQAAIVLNDLDLAAFLPTAPRTALAGRMTVAPDANAAYAITADLSNTRSGAWDQGLLPLDELKADGEWRDGAAVVRSFTARLGDGTVKGAGGWGPKTGWRVDTQVRALDPGAVHTQMAALALSGTLKASGSKDDATFDVNLRPAPAQRGANASRKPPSGPAAATGPGRGPNRAQDNVIANAVKSLSLQQVQASGRWKAGLLSLRSLQVRTADAQLQGALSVEPAARSGSGRLTLTAPGLQVHLDGSLAEKRGGGQARLASSDLATATQWLRRLPGVPADRLPLLLGSAQADLRWQGGWADPTVQAQLRAPLLQVGEAAAPARPRSGASSSRADQPRSRGPVPGVDASASATATATAPAAQWRATNVFVSLDGRLADAQIRADGVVTLGDTRVRADLAGQLGRPKTATDTWQGRLDQLRLAATDKRVGPGEWTVQLRQPVGLQLTSSGQLSIGAGQATLTAPVRSGPAQAALSWEPLRWGGGEAQVVGRLRGVPLSWLSLAGGGVSTALIASGDLVFDAGWDLRLGDTPRIQAQLARVSGDLTLQAETADGTPIRVAAGVREARISVDSSGEAVNVRLRWNSERAGEIDGQLATRLSRGGDAGWQWAADAPLEGRLQARLPRVGVWSLLAPPGWRLRGSLAADLRVSGVRSDPQIAGQLTADDVGLRSVVDGIALQDGRLRARLQGQRVLIDELLLRGAGGAAGGGGTLTATGQARWAGSAGLQLSMAAQLERLRASVRSDRQVTVSGQARASVDAGKTEITGDLRVDQARIVLPDEAAPALGDDVVVRNLPAGVTLRAPRGAGPGRPVRIAVNVTLGDDVRVQGRGIDTRLQGEVAVSGESLAQPRLNGVIRTSQGVYAAYDQRLNIERGVLRFTGAADNPALDILAIRPNLTQKVGVLISGRAQSPVVRLYADPELSEAEKLSWLVLGRPSAAGGAEAALLQKAAVTLLTQRAGGSGGGIAGRLGLDELSVRRDSTQGAAITLGKRFANNFYAAYERTLSGALGTLYVFYDLSRRVTVRAQAGDRSGVDLIYTLSFN